MFSSNTLTSVKRTRSLDNLFMFREFEKSLKRTLGVPFSYNLNKSEKVIKFYSVTFSCIYGHEKEQRLSSWLFSFLRKLKTKQNKAWDRVYFYTILKLAKTILGPGFIFTQAWTRGNYAWGRWFHFYTSLNQRKLCLWLPNSLSRDGWYLAPNLRS